MFGDQFLPENMSTPDAPWSPSHSSSASADFTRDFEDIFDAGGIFPTQSDKIFTPKVFGNDAVANLWATPLFPAALEPDELTAAVRDPEEPHALGQIGNFSEILPTETFSVIAVGKSPAAAAAAAAASAANSNAAAAAGPEETKEKPAKPAKPAKAGGRIRVNFKSNISCVAGGNKGQKIATDFVIKQQFYVLFNSKKIVETVVQNMGVGNLWISQGNFLEFEVDGDKRAVWKVDKLVFVNSHRYKRMQLFVDPSKLHNPGLNFCLFLSLPSIFFFFLPPLPEALGPLANAKILIPTNVFKIQERFTRPTHGLGSNPRIVDVKGFGEQADGDCAFINSGCAISTMDDNPTTMVAAYRKTAQWMSTVCKFTYCPNVDAVANSATLFLHENRNATFLPLPPEIAKISESVSSASAPAPVLDSVPVSSAPATVLDSAPVSSDASTYLDSFFNDQQETNPGDAVAPSIDFIVEEARMNIGFPMTEPPAKQQKVMPASSID